jgi:hypothetical protein
MKPYVGSIENHFVTKSSSKIDIGRLKIHQVITTWLQIHQHAY